LLSRRRFGLTYQKPAKTKDSETCTKELRDHESRHISRGDP
jgi:hypothetical protein